MEYPSPEQKIHIVKRYTPPFLPSNLPTDSNFQNVVLYRFFYDLDKIYLVDYTKARISIKTIFQTQCFFICPSKIIIKYVLGQEKILHLIKAERNYPFFVYAHRSERKGLNLLKSYFNDFDTK